MKKGIIIYQSKYGATQKYAKWLREMTGYDCVRTKEASLELAAQYKTIVLCGGIYASGIAGLMSAVGQKGDWTDKKYLDLLLEYLE